MSRRGTRVVAGGRSGLRSTLVLGLSAWLGLTFVSARQPVAAAGSYTVVVNAANTLGALPAGELSKIFLKKTERWESGFKATPVDLPSDSTCRQTFSRAVHGKDVKSVQKYWRKLVFSGLGEPPQELASGAAVIEFVGANVGAVGYVCGDVPSGGRVRTLEVVDGGN